MDALKKAVVLLWRYTALKRPDYLEHCSRRLGVLLFVNFCFTHIKHNQVNDRIDLAPDISVLSTFCRRARKTIAEIEPK